MRSATGRARSSAPTWPAHTQSHLAHVHASASARRRARRSARTAAHGGSAAGATRGRPALFCVLGVGGTGDCPPLRCDPLLARDDSLSGYALRSSRSSLRRPDCDQCAQDAARPHAVARGAATSPSMSHSAPPSRRTLSNGGPAAAGRAPLEQSGHPSPKTRSVFIDARAHSFEGANLRRVRARMLFGREERKCKRTARPGTRVSKLKHIHSRRADARVTPAKGTRRMQTHAAADPRPSRYRRPAARPPGFAVISQPHNELASGRWGARGCATG